MQEPFVLPQESLQRNGLTGVEATDICFAVSVSHMFSSTECLSLEHFIQGFD